MSAFYAAAYHDRVELLTDGAVYTDDGILTDIRRKVWTSPVTPLAVTGRGNTRIVEALASAIMCISGCGSFDATIVATQNLLDRRRENGVPDDVEMLICGISETAGPKILYFATCDAYGEIEPWTILDMDHELAGGPTPDVTGLDGSAGLRECGTELMDRMRHIPGPNPMKPDLPDQYGIGGHIDHTVVAADGCTTERIHEWLDVIGEKIDPKRYGFAEAA
jgi:hypothetical protein